MDIETLALARSYANKKVSEIPSPYKIKESVASFEDLPISGNEAGDVRETLDDGNKYYWDGDEWQAFAAYNVVAYTITYDDLTTETIHNIEAGD